MKKRNEGQMIVLMGFFLLVAVVVLASISADLSSIGTEVPQRHSKALLPDYISIKDKFVLSLNQNVDSFVNGAPTIQKEYGIDTSGLTFDEMISGAFDVTTDRIARLSLKQGNYFDAELIKWGYGGSVVQSDGGTGAVYNIKAILSLTDGKTSLSQNVSYLITIR